MRSNSAFKLFFALILGVSITLSGCKDDDREQFLGSYSVNESCTTGNISYSMTIVESQTSDDAIVLNNLGDFSPQVNVRATVSGTSINFNDTHNAITISGTGSVSGNTLTINYTASLSGATDVCVATAIKQ